MNKQNQDIQNSKVFEAFAMYLLQSFGFLDEEKFRILVQFVMIYAMGLDEEGWNVLQRQGARFEQKEKEQKFCLVNSCEHILEISNEFVTEFLPKELQKSVL